MTGHDPGGIERAVSAEVQRVVMAVLEESGLLNEPEALAKRLGAVPAVVQVLLSRDRWPLRTALAIADELAIPIEIKLERTSQPA